MRFFLHFAVTVFFLSHESCYNFYYFCKVSSVVVVAVVDFVVKCSYSINKNCVHSVVERIHGTWERGF